MTADDWLAMNGKAPYRSEESPYKWWYWGMRRTTDVEDEDLLLPKDLFDLLPGKHTYPDCKIYASRDEAMTAFREAFAKWGDP